MSRERTFAVTVGKWGGLYVVRRPGLVWRLCLGWVALTYFRGEMADALRAWVRDGEQHG